MSNNVQFEGKERRMAGIEACMKEYGIKDLEDARDICLAKGIDVDAIVKGVQPIAFDNAGWAYTLGCAVAIKKGDYKRCRRRRGYRNRASGVLHPRLRCRKPQGRSRSRKPRRHASP